MPRYNMDVTQPGNRAPTDARLRFNNPQGSSTIGDDKHLEQNREMLYNVTASTSGGVQRYKDQNCHRPGSHSNSSSSGNIISEYNAQCQYNNTNNLSGTVDSKGWKEQSGSSSEANQLLDEFFGVTHVSNHLSQFQNSLAYVDTSSNSVSTNQRQDLWYSDATSSSLQKDICNASSSYNEMHGYAAGNSTLTNHSVSNQSSDMTMPRSTQYLKQLSQPFQDCLESRSYTKQTDQTYAQQSSQRYSTQQMNQGQNQQLYPTQSNQWNLSVSQPSIQTHGPAHDVNHIQAQQTYHIEQQQLNQTQTPRLLLSRKNHTTQQSEKDEAEWSQSQQFGQDLTQSWNQTVTHETHPNKYQQMYRRQTQQWRQHHTGNDQQYQEKTKELQQNLIEQQQQNWTQPQLLQQCRYQQIQQNQTVQWPQNWTTPLQKCQTQHDYQNLNQQQETGLTPTLKDLQFPTTPTVRFSDSQNQLETNLTPILKANTYNQGRHRRVNELDSSTPQTAQKEIFQQTWSDRSNNLQKLSIDDGTNNFVRSKLWTGAQKENLPLCQSDITSATNFVSSNNVLAIEHRSNNLIYPTVQKPETSKTSSEFNIDAKTAADASLLNFLQQPGTSFNSQLPIQDLLSTEQQADQINVDISAATASCSNEQPLPKTSGTKLTCEICRKIFKFRSSLHAHHLRHLDPIKRYGCTTCDSKFSDRSSLRKHLRVHTGEQPFECKTCGLRFSQAGNLRRHERISHSKTDN